jgi:hypothetical protein
MTWKHSLDRVFRIRNPKQRPVVPIHSQLPRPIIGFFFFLSSRAIEQRCEDNGKYRAGTPSHTCLEFYSREPHLMFLFSERGNRCLQRTTRNTYHISCCPGPPTPVLLFPNYTLMKGICCRSHQVVHSPFSRFQLTSASNAFFLCSTPRCYIYLCVISGQQNFLTPFLR